METMEATPNPPAAVSDRKTFTRLVDRFYAKVYDYLCWLTRNETLAADLTQETFLCLWRHPPNLEAGGSLRAWMFKVALNVYRQQARRHAVETVPLSEAEEDVPDPESEPLVVLEREELCRAVQEAVARLPERYRAVILLHNLQGLTLTEVAQALEIPVGTVKSRLATAFARLRKSLREWEGGVP